MERGVRGIVLVGGRSRRMGRDKATLEVDGRTMVQRAVDALVAAGVSEIVLVGPPSGDLPPVAAAVPVEQHRDEVEGEGPLRGILAGLAGLAGLQGAPSAVAVVVGCDMPYLQPPLLALLARRAVEASRPVLPRHRGQPEGLCSAWPAVAAEGIRARLAAGDRAVVTVAEALDAVYLDPDDYAEADPTGRSFINVNTPDDLAALGGLLPG